MMRALGPGAEEVGDKGRGVVADARGPGEYGAQPRRVRASHAGDERGAAGGRGEVDRLSPPPPSRRRHHHRPASSEERGSDVVDDSSLTQGDENQLGAAFRRDGGRADANLRAFGWLVGPTVVRDPAEYCVLLSGKSISDSAPERFAPSGGRRGKGRRWRPHGSAMMRQQRPARPGPGPPGGEGPGRDGLGTAPVAWPLDGAVRYNAMTVARVDGDAPVESQPRSEAGRGHRAIRDESSCWWQSVVMDVSEAYAERRVISDEDTLYLGNMIPMLPAPGHHGGQSRDRARDP